MKPILFSTPMVQAILDGRKTMTRRVIKPQPPYGEFYGPDIYADVDKQGYEQPGNDVFGIWHEEGDWGIKCKYRPGDILWVRETWADLRGMGFGNDPQTDQPWNYAFRADTNPGSDGDRARIDYGVKWRPSIHMPREAARIFLRVTGVRVERLQEILCGDMRREGCIPETVTGGQYQQWQRDYWIPLWDSTIKKQDISLYGWDANPWVWVIEFERCEKP